MTSPPEEPRYYYRDGLAVLRAVREPPGWMDYDPRADAWVAPGHRLPELRAWAEERGVLEAGSGADALDAPFFDPRRPRAYQREALERWRAQAGRGTVVLPTGSGKSFVALLAIHELGVGACVVAPTKALLGQWFNQLADAFGAERVGAFYGDEKEPRPLTVTTYHSAFALLERSGQRFDLLVLDEAHHLADTAGGDEPAWHDALRIAPARFRLGLTATYPDDRDRGLRRLVGPVAYRRSVGEMVDAELADFALERRFVPLTEAEREAYDAATERYEGYVEERDLRERYGPDDWWKVFMAETRRSPRARRAFRAFRQRERLVALSERKLEEAGRLLRIFAEERAILFCGSTEAAEAVSRRRVAGQDHRRAGVHMADIDGNIRVRLDIINQFGRGGGETGGIVRVAVVAMELDMGEMGAPALDRLHRGQGRSPIAGDSKIVAMNMRPVREPQALRDRGELSQDLARRGAEVGGRLVEVAERHPADLLVVLDVAGVDDLDRIAPSGPERPGAIGLERVVVPRGDAIEYAVGIAQENIKSFVQIRRIGQFVVGGPRV